MTTPEQFDLFCSECNKWIDEYGLYDWEILFAHTELDNHVQASIEWDYSARLVTFSLNTDVSIEETTDDSIIKSAHHEVLELLLVDLEVMCSAYNRNEQEKLQFITSTRHSVIHRLMNCESSRRERMRKLLAEKGSEPKIS